MSAGTPTGTGRWSAEFPDSARPTGSIAPGGVRRRLHVPPQSMIGLNRTRPTFPRIRSPHYLRVVVGLLLGVLMVGTVLALARSVQTGLLAVLVGVAVVMLVNPVIWAATLRADDRDLLDGLAPRRHGDDARA